MGFLLTRRYIVSVLDGFYNLTIMNVNMSESGEYICHEDLQNGPRTSTLLTVLGEISEVFLFACAVSLLIKRNTHNDVVFNSRLSAEIGVMLRPFSR